MIGSPPRPSIVPPPPTPAPVVLLAAISGKQLEAPPVPVLHAPALASKSRGFRDAKSVTPVSTQRVTPLFRLSGPLRSALLLPFTASFTAWPAGHAVIAAWMACVSSAASSVNLPSGAFFVASTVAHAGGI